MKSNKPKVTMVDLVNDMGDTQQFTIDHAERILRMPSSGWSLPEDSPYQFEYYNGIERRTSNSKGAEA